MTGGNVLLSITEGRNRQIRRMVKLSDRSYFIKEYKSA